MLICPKCHSEWPTKYRYCPDCQAALIALPIEEGDQVNIRSPKQVTYVNTAPTAAAPPARVKCPRCGRKPLEAETFDCVGPCGRQHLCERHFDEEYEMCRDCADVKRGIAEQEAARQAQLQDDLKTLTAQTQRLTAELTQVTAARDKAQNELAETHANLRRVVAAVKAGAIAGQADLSSAQKTLAEWRARAEKAEAGLAQAIRERDAHKAELSQVQKKLRTAQATAERAAVESQTKLAALEKSLAEWRGRGEKAEGRLADIARKAKAEAEAKAEAARRAAEAAKQQPLWQRIGIELVTIPAGEFLYGDDKRRVNLPAYRIARTPVTNAQYKAFVDATGHQVPGHWSSGQVPQGKEQHPVVNVSWDDAQAFCAWAGLRLPTDQEWEKAARGTDGRAYPWGAWELGRCNSSEAKIGATTPVDRFPSGASPYGVLDAAGNVWEWCADYYDTNKGSRVLRGGSFSNEARHVRCAVRHRYHSEDRFDNVGFRVVSPGL